MSEIRTSEEQLAKWEALARAATPGPWKQAHHVGAPAAIVAEAAPMDSLLALDKDGMAVFARAEDAALVAATRGAIVPLIDSLRSVRGVYADTIDHLCALAIHMGVATPDGDELCDGPSPMWEAWTKAQARIAELEAENAALRAKAGA